MQFFQLIQKVFYYIKQATRDGFENKALHDRCDNAINTVIVIRNNLNYIFGGFTVAKWGSNLGYITDPFAFLFSLRRNGGLTNYKLMIKDGARSRALNSHPLYGPTFGSGEDLFLRDKSNIFTGSSSYIEDYTQPSYPSGSDRYTFLTGGFQNWLTLDIEVYQIFY